MLEEEKRKFYLGEGKPPPKGGYKRLFNTPEGPFPKLVDVALKYGMFKGNVHRKNANKSDNLSDWHNIDNPTEEQIKQATINVNKLYLAKYEAEDHCELCNSVDDMIFAEGCWLLKVVHHHVHDTTSIDDLYNSVSDMILPEGYWLAMVMDSLGITHSNENIDKAVIHYTYARKDYRVSYRGWKEGERPHLVEQAHTYDPDKVSVVINGVEYEGFSGGEPITISKEEIYD